MPTYVITAPNGQDYEIDTPEGVSEEQALSYFQQNWKPQTQVEITPEMKEQAYREAAMSTPWLERNAAAMVTPFVGGYQAVKEIFGAGDPEVVARNKALQQEAPVGAIAGAVVPSLLIPGVGATTAAGRIGLSTGAGAASGLLTPTGKEQATLSDKSTQVGTGALIGGIFGAGFEGVKLLYRGIRNLVSPTLSEAGAQKAAARITRAVTNGKSDDIAEMLRKGEIDETAVQAAVKSGNPEFAALGKLVESSRKPGEFDAIYKAQEATRKRLLTSVTPNKNAAVSSREIAAAPWYSRADQAVVTVDPKLQQLFDRMPSGVMESAANIARMEGRQFNIGQNANGLPQITGESMHYIKRALSDIANSKEPASGMGRDAQRAAQSLLNDYLKAFEARVPAYKTARKIFADRSSSVNQADVLNEMQSILAKPTGGERVQPFLNALGRGEAAMLKRSTGQPRYESGDLANVLTPTQMGAVERISGQMTRDVEADRLAKVGMEKVRREVGSFADSVPQVGLLNRVATITNAIIKRLEGKGGEKVETTLAELMLPQNKAKFAALLEKATPSERRILLEARASLAAGAGVGQFSENK